jgi:hypothetical protein
MLDDIVSETDRALVPVQPAAPEPAAAADPKASPGASMFGAVPLRDPEKFVADATTRSPQPDSVAPEIKIQPTDVRGRAPRKEEAAAPRQNVSRQGDSFFVRVLRFGARALVVACLCAMAWAAGAYYSLGHSPFGAAKPAQALETPPGAGHDDMVNTMRQMSDDMRALKADIAQSASQKTQLDSAPAPAGATSADVMGRIDRLDAEVTARLSQVDQQLASIEQKIATAHTALASRTPVAHKHPKHLHDAFDPSHDPGAPGAPHPLGMQ